MASSDLCQISNAYKPVEYDTDSPELSMEENSLVRELITKILDDSGSTDIISAMPPPEKVLNVVQTNGHNPKTDAASSYIPAPYNTYNQIPVSNQNLISNQISVSNQISISQIPVSIQNPVSNQNYSQNDQNGYSYMQNGFPTTNGFANYTDNDVNALLGVDIPDMTELATPEQLNLIRLAAQHIGGAQFQTNKFEYNFFEPNQRNSLPNAETNMFPPNSFRPNSLNVDATYNNFENPAVNRCPNNFKDSQDPAEILCYLTQLNASLERSNQENINNIDFKMPIDLNTHYQTEELKMLEDRNKMMYNRSFNQPNKNFENNQYFDNMQIDRGAVNQINYEYPNQALAPVQNGNFKPNGYHQNEFMPRRDMNQMMHREQFPIEQRNNVENNGRDMQQMAAARQNQELARQMSLLMRNRPPPNPLNVDVTFMHENNPYNMRLGAILGPSPPVPPPVLQSPMLELPLLAPFYAMRNMRNAVTSSGILHARLDACYEQWRQLERERKRTEARLALAYPGRAVSSSNSIPVPRLPPCPSRVDRLTVDMLREHTKVLTLMGKMETLRASVCIAQSKKRPEENKITVLKRGQENVAHENKDGLDPASFDPTTWSDDVKNFTEIAPHKEVESAMLSWRNAVSAVQSARKREMQHHRGQAHDPIMVLAEAVKQLCQSARRARTAMWCDLTLTVALAPPPTAVQPESNQAAAQSMPPKQQQDSAPKASTSAMPTAAEAKEENTATEPPKDEAAASASTSSTAGTNNIKNGAAKQTDKDKNHQQRRSQNYKKVNQRNDFYRNQRYDSRFMNRHPYHYLATGPIN